ncbi:TPA: hypothetical protein IAA82_06185 [Candidatus Galligastranaerophilus gallistercoris]|nr:hypothetical protein [Candidatus Galligastranaerophilus gallistercoris]
MDLKNLKIVKKLKNIAPKIKWVMFKNVQDYKINSQYIDYIIPEEKKGIEYDNLKLENMVKESLIKEFGPKIKSSKSFNLLVDAVVHNLKKKQLSSFDDIDDEIDAENI